MTAPTSSYASRIKQGWHHYQYDKPPENQLIEVIDCDTNKTEVVVWRALGGMSFTCLCSRPDFMNRNRIRFRYWNHIKTKPIPIDQKMQSIKESQGF